MWPVCSIFQLKKLLSKSENSTRPENYSCNVIFFHYITQYQLSLNKYWVLIYCKNIITNVADKI